MPEEIQGERKIILNDILLKHLYSTADNRGRGDAP